jgi:hypothetical protein
VAMVDRSRPELQNLSSPPNGGLGISSVVPGKESITCSQQPYSRHRYQQKDGPLPPLLLL